MNLAATVTMDEIKLTSLKISGSEGDNDNDFESDSDIVGDSLTDSKGCIV